MPRNTLSAFQGLSFDLMKLTNIPSCFRVLESRIGGCRNTYEPSEKAKNQPLSSCSDNLRNAVRVRALSERCTTYCVGSSAFMVPGVSHRLRFAVARYLYPVK